MSTQRHSIWSITINNPTPADEEDIARARQKGWKVDGQLEKGENGTPHYQLMVSSGQVRFSAVKKAFPRGHIEPARNAKALEQYVHKEDTKVAGLALSNDKYPSLSKFWQLVYQHIFEMNWIAWPDFDHWWDDVYADLEYPRPRDDKGRAELAQLVFEACVGHLIDNGYHVEHFYSPPNISVFKKFTFALLNRSRLEIEAQTARQTDVRSEPEEDIPHINIPTHVDEEDVSQEEDESSPSDRSTTPSP